MRSPDRLGERAHKLGLLSRVADERGLAVLDAH